MTREELEAGCIRVACPKCEGGEGESCNKPNGDRLAKPHAVRIKAYAAELEAARRRAEGDALERIENPRWRRTYKACRLELENRAQWTSLAAEQLEGMILNMIEADFCRRQAKGAPTVPGSTGQATKNPTAALALHYDAQALATARALKLTPDTRGTSTEVPDEPDDDVAGAEEERDELAAIDLMAERAKRQGAKGRRRRAAK